jgi:hypothetical protein
MKILLILAMVLAAMAALNTDAGAQENTPDGIEAETGCSFGDCFAPLFFALNVDARYTRTSGSQKRVEFADCCVPGDTYRVFVRGTNGTATVQFRSTGTLTSTCSVGPYADSYAVELRSTREVRMRALSAPGGLPAGAYVRMQGTNWVRVAGADACGF